MPCPNCQSAEIKQTKYTTGAGWALAVVGLIGGILFCWPALLILAAACMTELRARCCDCGWTWRC